MQYETSVRTKVIYAIVTLLVIIFALSITPDSAAQSNQNGQASSEDEYMMVKKDQLPQNLRSRLEQQQKVEQYGEYVGLGKEIGTAIDGSLSAITENANAFADTKVGTWVMVLVTYKIIGSDLLRLTFGIPLCLFILSFGVWSFRKNCITRSVKYTDGEGNEKYRIVNDPKDHGYDDMSNEAKMVAHVSMTLIVLAVAMLFTFG